MNVNYSEALEQQISLLHRAEAKLRVDPSITDGEAVFYRAARFGSTFFIADAGFQLVMAGAATLPKSLRLPVDMVPSRQGFAVFDRALPQVSTTALTFVRGFVWDTVKVQSVAGEARGSGIAIGALLEGQSRNPYAAPVLVPGVVASWRQDLSMGDAVRHEIQFGDTTIDPSGELIRSLFSLFGSFCSFVEQRILVTRGQVLERHARRRLEREGWDHEAVVQVVELRRREHVTKQAVEPVEREWSCQWVVRGHWRQQPYPKVGAVRPKWITPYVKGPDDKPLKPPRATVFAVVR